VRALQPHARKRLHERILKPLLNRPQAPIEFEAEVLICEEGYPCSLLIIASPVQRMRLPLGRSLAKIAVDDQGRSLGRLEDFLLICFQAVPWLLCVVRKWRQWLYDKGQPLAAHAVFINPHYDFNDEILSARRQLWMQLIMEAFRRVSFYW